jgi:hypothetical protein
MNIKKVLVILKPLSKYCHDNKIQQPVYEVDMVRNNKVWICCHSGRFSGIAIGDIYEDVLSDAIQNFVANFPFPYEK